MPFYKVPAVTSNDNGPKRIRAPLRHSVNNGGGAGVATTSRDCDVISSDSTVSADKSKLQTRHSDQVVLKPLVQQDRLAVSLKNTPKLFFVIILKSLSIFKNKI